MRLGASNDEQGLTASASCQGYLDHDDNVYGFSKVMFGLDCFKVDVLKLPKNMSRLCLDKLSAIPSKYPFIKHSDAKRSKGRPPQPRRKGIIHTGKSVLAQLSRHNAPEISSGKYGV